MYSGVNLIFLLRFLADANWTYIDSLFLLEENEEDNKRYSSNMNHSLKMSVCPECLFRHPNSPNDKEIFEIAEDWR